MSSIGQFLRGVVSARQAASEGVDHPNRGHFELLRLM